MKSEQLGHEARVVGRVALDRGTPRHPDDLTALEQRQVAREARNACGESHDEIASLPRYCPQSRFCIRAADGIEDHIGAMRTGGLEELSHRAWIIDVGRINDY